MEYIEDIKKTLNSVQFVSMATVNEDNSPHNSPVVFMFDKNLNYIYWGSHPESQHSKNVLRTKQAYFVAFNSIEKGRGVYISTVEGQIVEDEELQTALDVHNRFRKKIGKDSIDLSYYQGNNPQRMWRAKVDKVWVNAYEKDLEGKLAKDYKIEVDKKQLGSLYY